MRNDDWTSGRSELNGGVDGHSYFSQVDCTPLHGKGISVGGTPRHTTTKVVHTSNEFLKKKRVGGTPQGPTKELQRYYLKKKKKIVG